MKKNNLKPDSTSDRKLIRNADAIILCNGVLPSKRIALKILSSTIFLICADGGANSARVLGVIPDVIIGDLDSITTSTKAYYMRTNRSR